LAQKEKKKQKTKLEVNVADTTAKQMKNEKQKQLKSEKTSK